MIKTKIDKFNQNSKTDPLSFQKLFVATKLCIQLFITQQYCMLLEYTSWALNHLNNVSFFQNQLKLIQSKQIVFIRIEPINLTRGFLPSIYKQSIRAPQLKNYTFSKCISYRWGFKIIQWVYQTSIYNPCIHFFQVILSKPKSYQDCNQSNNFLLQKKIYVHTWTHRSNNRSFQQHPFWAKTKQTQRVSYGSNFKIWYEGLKISA